MLSEQRLVSVGLERPCRYDPGASRLVHSSGVSDTAVRLARVEFGPNRGLSLLSPTTRGRLGRMQMWAHVCGVE
jgi:hypothetical protein